MRPRARGTPAAVCAIVSPSRSAASAAGAITSSSPAAIVFMSLRRVGAGVVLSAAMPLVAGGVVGAVAGEADVIAVAAVAKVADRIVGALPGEADVVAAAAVAKV